MSEIDSLEYNTARPKMLIPEYGRNVQKMVDHAISLSDREERNKVAQAIIMVMGELKPELRDVEEYKPKLWTHLFVMSDFNLDVDSPYPMPNPETLSEPPATVPYPQSKVRVGHYGKNVQKLIDIAKDMEEGGERDALIKTVACMMKLFYLTFNTLSVEDKMIADHINKFSDGKIILTDLSFLPSTGTLIKLHGIKAISEQSNTNNKNKNNKNRNNKNNNNKNRHNKNKNRKRY